MKTIQQKIETVENKLVRYQKSFDYWSNKLQEELSLHPETINETKKWFRGATESNMLQWQVRQCEYKINRYTKVLGSLKD